MPPFNLLKFRPKPADRSPTAPQEPAPRYALYPLGTDDVIMSVPTFDVVLHVLVNGTQADRQELALMLRRMYDATMLA